jgi:hypothetical protein
MVTLYKALQTAMIILQAAAQLAELLVSWCDSVEAPNNDD